MQSIVLSFLCFGCLIIQKVSCDYTCLCSYQVELEIFEKPDSSSNVDGYMYEFDCKPSYNVKGLDPAYKAVGNEGKLGYVLKTSNTQTQTCQGSIPDIDRVKFTTSLPTTTTTMMTMITTTMRPSTMTTIEPSSTTKSSAFPTTFTTMPPSMIMSSHPTTSTRSSTMTHSATSTTPSSTRTSPTTTKVSANSCPGIVNQNAKPQNIFQHGGICYEFVPLNNSWEQAKFDCKSKGGHLVSIESEDKQIFVSGMLDSIHFKSPVWLGLHDKINEEQWQWDTGAPANYTNWYPGRFIDQYHDQEDCGLMVPVQKYRWDDVDCNGVINMGFISYGWICQYW